MTPFCLDVEAGLSLNFLLI